MTYVRLGGEIMSNLRNGVGDIIEFFEPIIRSVETYVYDGDDTDQFWEFLKRGIVKRQFESIKAILNMVDSGFGHFGVTLLRPAYEELVWVEYLDQNAEIANELVLLLANHDIARNLSAQNDYIGAKEMLAGGFSQRYVKVCLARDRITKKRIKEIGSQLGWREGAIPPSMAFLSRKVGREPEYRFLYQGTSRFVHFSTGEILRRVWGKSGEVTIGSTSFSSYWQEFAMYWSFRIFGQLISPCIDIFDEFDISDRKLQEMLNLIGSFRPIPIITPQELTGLNPRGP